MKKQVKYISAGMLAGMLLCGGQMQAANTMSEMYVCVTDAIQKDNRPEVSKRLFRSNAVEKEILRVQKLLKNEKLAWMFTNCFPNTIDTTVHFRKGEDGNRIHLFTPEISMRCGFVTRAHRYGRMFSWQTLIRN